MGRSAGGRTRRLRPLSLDGVTTYPLAARASKLSRAQLARPHRKGGSLASFISGLPRVLAGDTLRELRDAILRARDRRRPIVWGLGAHVVKVGLAPVLIDLMERGFVTGIALNGAGIVHDFELAVAGATSEDVQAGLGTGQFGMARETGEELGRAVVEGEGARTRPGRERRAVSLRAPPACALPRAEPARGRLAAGARRRQSTSRSAPTSSTCIRPATRGRSAAPLTSTSACSQPRWRGSGAGGVYLNVGSAVVLPEVFLKALTLARNLGHRVTGFSTANLDFIQSYRPGVNVVERPVAGHGRGFRLTGHHEILVPLVAAALVEAGGRGGVP